MIEGVHAVARIDALDKMYLAMIGRGAYKIGAGAVESHGIKRGENAYVAHCWVFGRRIAVAVDRQIVCYTDVEDLVAAMVGYGFGGFGHGFEEVVLLRKVLPQAVGTGDFACGVYPCFAV